jgi:hypothetical protein
VRGASPTSNRAYLVRQSLSNYLIRNGPFVLSHFG